MLNATKSTLEKAYLAEAEIINKKYDRQYNSFDEGKAVLSVMMQFNYDKTTLAAVIEKNSLNEQDNIDNNYVEKIIQQCEAAKERYAVISNYSNKISKNLSPIPQEMYCQCVAQLMHYTGIKEISGKDDIKIVCRMIGIGISKEDIKNVLDYMSPVATMPGRNAKYSEIIFTHANKEYETKREYAKKNFEKASQMYDQNLKSLQNKLNNKKQALDIEKNKIFYIGMIAKKLLNTGFYYKHIINIISEKLKTDNRFEFKSMKYAYYIVSAVKRQLSAEKEIVNYIPGQNVDQMNITDIYRKSIQERIKKYPSVINELSEKYIDIDACVDIFNRYSSTMHTENLLPALLEVINKASPRAQMPGIGEKYAEHTVEEAIEKCKYAQNEHKKIELRYENYKKECELMKEGAEKNYEYQDGRYAIEQLQKGVDKAEIISTIVELSVIAVTMTETNRYEYAQEIIEKSQMFIERLNKIKEEDFEGTDITTVYMKAAHDAFLVQDYLTTKNDVAIAENLLENKFGIGEIRDVISNNSPMSVEAGRSESYPDYVTDKAQQNLQKTLEKGKSIEQNEDIGHGYSLEFKKKEE